MNKNLKLLRVFLGSPGDLQDERCLAFEAVEELNRVIASNLGYRVELVGWEDTLPGCGRPQELINQDLDSCELFIRPEHLSVRFQKRNTFVVEIWQKVGGCSNLKKR